MHCEKQGWSRYSFHAQIAHFHRKNRDKPKHRQKLLSLSYTTHKYRTSHAYFKTMGHKCFRRNSSWRKDSSANSQWVIKNFVIVSPLNISLEKELKMLSLFWNFGSLKITHQSFKNKFLTRVYHPHVVRNDEICCLFPLHYDNGLCINRIANY